MPNPTTFGQPSVPITINLPVNQLPQPTAAASQQAQQQQPQQQPQPIPEPQSQPPQKQPKLPSAHYYVFPWKHVNKKQQG